MVKIVGLLRSQHLTFSKPDSLNLNQVLSVVINCKITSGAAPGKNKNKLRSTGFQVLEELILDTDREKKKKI